MNCTLPFKSSLDNSKHFLTEVTEALSEDFTIIDPLIFDKAIDQLEQESIRSYGVSGKSWIRDITQDNLKATPNLRVLDRIDEKRKELGLYDKQLSGSDQSDLGEEFIPIPEDNQVIYKFRLINALESDKVRQPKLDNLQGFINDISKQGVSNQQIDILKDTINKLKERNQLITKQDLITELLVNYSYGVEINVAEINSKAYRLSRREQIDYESALVYTKIDKKEPTSYYSNLTVPGGTNYREIELRTPGITPSITGHAQFSTKEGIGWFRSDDKAINQSREEYEEYDYDGSNFLTNKTRRLIELQSDLFQKGRDKDNLINKQFLTKSDIPNLEGVAEIEQHLTGYKYWLQDEGYSESEVSKLVSEKRKELEKPVTNISPQNKFLQLLNKDNNWVTFFVKSFIQDSAKRGYEKVLFPSGNTASKIEGHETLEEFKKEKEDRIKILEQEIEDLKNRKGSTTFKILTETGWKPADAFTNAETARSEIVQFIAKLEENGTFHAAYIKRTTEINQLKQELERVEREGFVALKPIYNFYENTVTNILKKQGYNPIRITDEYGNTWNEVVIDRSRDLTDILFSQNTGGYYDIGLRNRFFEKGDTDLKSVLEKISKSNHVLALLATKLLKNSNNRENVKILLNKSTPEEYKGFLGYYDPKTNEIHIFEDGKYLNGDSTSVILHEIIHALTYSKLKDGLNRELIDNFEELRNKAKEQLGDEFSYQTQNLDEFITGIFTNGKFIKRLQSLEGTSKKYENLWDELFNYVLNILGITKKDSLYNQAFSVASQIIESNNDYLFPNQEFYQLDSESILSTEITPELKSNLEQFVTKLNPDFKIEILDDLLERKGVNGIAQIKDFVIQLQKGKEGALVEEVSHFLIELMKDDNPLKKTMRDEVTRTRLYKKVAADYRKIYGNDVDRLKRETMAKLVSLYLTDKELFKYWTGSDFLVENVVRWIKDFFRWIKGETTSIGAFIKSAEKIVNLDTNGLYKERAAVLEDMYSLGDFVKESTILTTVGNVDTKYYPKVFINISDTLFNSSKYPWKNKGDKSKVLMGLDKDALEEFYSKVEFTQLGKELQDKTSTIENFEFYTSLPSHPTLIERLNLLFPGVQINFVNRETEVFDEDGNPFIIETNPVEELIESNKNALFIDNKPPYAGKGFKFKLYTESKKEPYEPFLDRVRRKERIDSQRYTLQNLLKTFKQADRPSLTESIGRAFSIITSETKEIARLEQRLGKQLQEEEFSSLFRDDGDLLLPTSKASQGRQLLDKINRYEELLTHFVGTLEAVTEFFRRRNNANYEEIRERLKSGTQEDIDIAIQELSLVTKMGNKWRAYIDDLRNVLKNVPNTDTVNSLLGELLTQIESSKLKSRDLSVQVIASKLAPYLDSYNLHKKLEIEELKERLEKAPEAAKIEIQKSIDKLEKNKDEEGLFISAKDIVDILNGETEDISPLTVWIKVLYNSSDPLIGTLFTHLEKIKATVEVDEIAPAQRLGQFIADEESKSGLTSKEWQDKILYLDDTLEFEEGKLVPKKSWTLLHPFMNEWKRDEKQYQVNQARKKWIELKNDNSSSEESIKEAHDEYLRLRDDFDKWLNINWHREYRPEFYSKYDALIEENKKLFEEVREEQSRIYNEIESLSLDAKTMEGLSLRDTNRKILALRNELKTMKRPVYFNGDPKVGKDLEIALLLQKKAEIDQEFYEYKPDVSKFRTEFQVFLITLGLDKDIEDNLRLKLIEGKDNFVSLYKYAKENSLTDVLEWLDNNTITKFHQDWYDQRKQISDQLQTLSDRVIEITGVDNKSKLGDLWNRMFSLTSHLRDEDNVFDGIESTPEIQQLVKEIDEEIESIKKLTREETKENQSVELKEIKKEIGDLVSKLNDIQSKDVTDSYKDIFNQMMSLTGFTDLHNDTATYMWVEGLKITDFITRSDFHKTLEENPDHEFTKWFYDNHFLKTVFSPQGEFKQWTPTYIWHKIEPVNNEYILLSPSHKYSNRTVREKWNTEKTDLTFNERLNKWNPKSEEFQNPEYRKLLNSADPKDVAAFRILKQVTDYHLNTQAATSVREGNLGYVLPYIKKQVYEEGYLKSLKKDFFDSSNRFEEGAGNYDEQASKMPGFKKVKDKFLAWWRNQEQEEETKTDTERALRVAVPFTKYHEPDLVSKDVLMSVIRFSASTKTADKLMKSLPLISLIENSMVTNTKTKNRVNALRFGKENIIYGINQQEEVGKPAENIMRTIRKVNTLGSLGFNIPNVVKNNLQGRLQNMIGAEFGDWSSNKAMTKASLNFKTSYAHYLGQAEKPLEKRDKDYHIITWLNPSLDSNIFNNLAKGATLKNLSTKGIMAFNEMMEFSISVNLMYARLYHVQVKNDKGEQKSLYDIITSNEVMGVEPGWKDVKTGQTIDMDYMMNTRLAYKTVVEYVQGRVSNKTFLSTITIGQAVLYFKNWLIPMLRRRFDKKRANYMMGEDFEGYWNVFFKSSLNLLRDILTTGRANWHAMTPREQREYITAVKEIGVMMATLAILSLVFGFEADDPDKFKKLKKNSFAENYAILMIIQAKNETEALSAMPFFNLEESFVPPVLTEGVKWLESPTIGLSIIDNTWKLTNSLYDLAIGSPDAYYQRNMPQFDIEKGDTKFFRHLLKITQFDDILINEDPEQKIRSVISNIKR